jgi:hypothetical protein
LQAYDGRRVYARGVVAPCTSILLITEKMAKKKKGKKKK